METTAPARGRPRLFVAISCASLCAFALILTARRSPPSAHFHRFAAKPSAEALDVPGMACKEADGPLAGGINSAVQWAVGQVPLRPRISHLPVEAKLRVGLYTTHISNISLQAVTVEDVAMRACKRPRDVFKNVPRALPDVIMVRVTGINVHMGLNYDSDGLCGLWCVGGVAGAAVSRAVGALNLTVSYQRADLTEVTDCNGDFSIEHTAVVGAHAKSGDLPSLSGLPIGRILCYGTQPKGLWMSVATSVEVIDTRTGEVLDKSFPGLVALLNAQFASDAAAQVMPKLRLASENMHEAQVDLAERLG